MKKRIFTVFMMVFVLTMPITDVFGVTDLYPKHTTEQSKQTEITETIAFVYANMTEDYMTDVMLYAAAAENTDIYLYPLGADIEPLLLKPTKECSEAAFSKYLVSTNQEEPIKGKLTTALDMLSAKTTDKSIMLYVDDVEFKNVSTFMSDIKDIFSQYPEIKSYISMSYVVSEVENTTLYNFFDIGKLGYDRCPQAYYEKMDGKLTISAGKADRNMLIFAQATKSELLYISGYMASSQTVAEYATNKTIKGVSLGYNNVYISKNENPKNIGIALFTISDEVGDTATDSFEVIIKNADTVYAYYKSSEGAGTASANTSYDKTQDDKIRNVDGNDNPSVISKEEAKNNEELAYSLVNTMDTEQGTVGKIWSVVANIISTVFSVLWLILRLLLFVFIMLMILHKKFRGNVMTKVYASKYGPSFQRMYEKLSSLINTYFVASKKKIKGNASLQGKFVFISHASIDLTRQGSVVEALVAELESQGVKCWTSEAGIDGSEDYNTVLPQAIKKCAMMILFLSPASVASTEVESEVIAGKRERKTIYPVQIAEFDLFSDDKWQHLLTQYQVKSLTTINPQEVKMMADSIKKIYDNLQ